MSSKWRQRLIKLTTPLLAVLKCVCFFFFFINKTNASQPQNVLVGLATATFLFLEQSDSNCML